MWIVAVHTPPQCACSCTQRVATVCYNRDGISAGLLRPCVLLHRTVFRLGVCTAAPVGARPQQRCCSGCVEREGRLGARMGWLQGRRRGCTVVEAWGLRCVGRCCVGSAACAVVSRRRRQKTGLRRSSSATFDGWVFVWSVFRSLVAHKLWASRGRLALMCRGRGTRSVTQQHAPLDWPSCTFWGSEGATRSHSVGAQRQHAHPEEAERPRR